ncbi:uncharacterized protein LOC110068630 isoform X2 [Orbicella faveolata]|uniref:uncharacterized protein LOC110068630 isoform X2 n=1 Tax=Orbicella faveolata TaxID=48498 RepID=UPI0009E2CA9D|nr:uncharacterized protein LOC110068630 isoform X2 [Orbicella faveolata]
MKILLLKQSIALFCLLLTEVCSSENFQIVRGTPWDSFTIPPTKCDEDNNAFDYCGEYNATAANGKRCECVCRDKQATFSVYKQSWSCLRDEDTRTHFGCSQPTFFDKERDDDKLSLLGSGNKKKLDLTGSNCKINTISSWYMDCDGNKDTVESMENTFDIEEDPRNNELEVDDLPTNSPLAGRIINLGISCSPEGQQTNQNYCLLFKLKGTTSCPMTVTQPTTTTTTTTVVDMVLKSALPEAGLGMNPTQVFTPPNVAADQSIADDGGPASLGVTVGVTVGIILIVLLVGIIIYQRHSARKHPRTISEVQSSQSDSGSQPRDQNEGYETLSTYRSAIYSSNYDVPNGGGSEDERAHLRSPRAPSTSEGLDNNGLDREEPFYSTVDELCSECSGKPGEYVDPASSERSRDFRPFSVEQHVYNMMEVLNTNTSDSPCDHGSDERNNDHVPLSVEQRVSNMIEGQNTDTSGSSYEYVDPASSERSRNIGPLSVEQGVYNMMEDLNTNTSDSPYDYASNEGKQNHVPLSVEQRVYNLIEVFDTVTEDEPNSSDPSHKETPVYNVLGEPLLKDARDTEKTCSSIEKDPVYNVLEGPEPGKTEETTNDTLYNTKQQDNNSNTFLYAVA